ncbi:MAG TPA: YIP1 family protein [Tenuifilaceae bacterium]|nr:YIP1 family protein [Tenuifilaceae bacterium]
MSRYTTNDIISNLKRIAQTIVDPDTAWLNEQAKVETKSQLVWGFIVPLMAICSAVTFLGVFLISHNAWFAFRHLLAAFINGVLGILAISYVANELSVSFGGTKSITNALKLITFSSSVFFVVASISRFMPTSRMFFMLLGLYSLFLFYKGIGPMLSIKAERKVGYVFILFLLFVMIVFIIELLLSPLFSLTIA